MPQTNITILAVDDDLEDLELIEDCITNLEPSARIIKITDGSKLLSYLNDLNDGDLPCLIILDYNMPEMNGAEVIGQLAKFPRFESIPKVIFSTSNLSRHINESMNNGATGYFVKPNNMKELNRVGREMLSYCGKNDHAPSGK